MVAFFPMIGVVAQEIDPLIAFTIHDSKGLSIRHYTGPVSARWNDVIGKCGFHRIASRGEKGRSLRLRVPPKRNAAAFVYCAFNDGTLIARLSGSKHRHPLCYSVDRGDGPRFNIRDQGRVTDPALGICLGN